MLVGLNALDFFPARMGGIETYFRNLVEALQALPADGTRYALLCLRPLASEFPLTHPSFRAKEFAFGRPSPGWLARRALSRATGRDLLAPFVNRLGLDVVHHPFTTINTSGLRAPAVVTFHDMQHEFLPQLFARRELETRRRLYAPSMRAASRVIAISRYVKTTLVDRYHVDAAKIDVVYQAQGAAFHPARDPASVQAARRRHGLARPFLFFPAAAWPHKNHRGLLEALRILRDRSLFDGDLVLSGIAPEAQAGLAAEAQRLGVGDRVRVLGYLPAGELPDLYRAAELLAFPSLFEGFGIPLLEAMACGCPVVCSSTTSLPEIAGGAALLFDPRSPEEMAARIAEVLGSTSTRERLRAAGFARAAQFRWDRAARETVEVYRRAAGRG